MIKVLAIAKWIFLPVAMLVWGVKYTDYSEWFEHHWITIVGNTVGTGVAVVDFGATMQATPITHDFWTDMYLIGMAALKASIIVLCSLGTTRAFKWAWPENKK